MSLASALPGVPPGGARQPLGFFDRWPVMLLVCLVAILPLLPVGIAPLTDLYGHLGRHAVQTELASRPGLQPYFSYDWQLMGNLGGDILVQVLHPLLGVEGAVRATVILTQLLGALGLMLVSRELHGRITPFAIAAIALLYGYPFNYGFINYTLSMALALLAYALWLRLRREGRERAAGLWLAAAGAGVWVCHTYGWAFLGLLCGSTMLAEVFAARMHPFAAVRRILVACSPLLLPLVPMVIWRAGSSGAAISGWDWEFKTKWLIAPLRTYWRDLDEYSAAALAALPLWALFSRTVRLHRGMTVAAVLCALFFLALPFRVFGSAFADMRLLPYAMAAALLAIGPVRLGAKTLAAAGALALGIFGARMVTTAAAYVEQDRKVQSALLALDKVPEGARVAFFSVKPCITPWALAPLDHLAGAAMARRSAFVNDQWQQPGVNPLKVRYPAAEPFTRDPSHLVQREDCARPTTRPKLSAALAKLPREAFTHIWIVGEYAPDMAAPEGFVPVPVAGRSLLFAAAPAPPARRVQAAAR